MCILKNKPHPQSGPFLLLKKGALLSGGYSINVWLLPKGIHNTVWTTTTVPQEVYMYIWYTKRFNIILHLPMPIFVRIPGGLPSFLSVIIILVSFGAWSKQHAQITLTSPLGETTSLYHHACKWWANWMTHIGDKTTQHRWWKYKGSSPQWHKHTEYTIYLTLEPRFSILTEKSVYGVEIGEIRLEFPVNTSMLNDKSGTCKHYVRVLCHKII